MGQRDKYYQFCGIIEMDDGYVGGCCHDGKRGRGTTKPKIVVALSKTENGVALFVRMKLIENDKEQTLQQIVNQYFAEGARVECNGYRSYLNLRSVQMEPKKYQADDPHWLHKAINNPKAFLLGTYHGRCTKLQSYLDEFCLRFNRRMTGNQVFLRLPRAVATSCGVLS